MLIIASVDTPSAGSVPVSWGPHCRIPQFHEQQQQQQPGVVVVVSAYCAYWLVLTLPYSTLLIGCIESIYMTHSQHRAHHIASHSSIYENNDVSQLIQKSVCFAYQTEWNAGWSELHEKTKFKLEDLEMSIFIALD